MSENNTGRPTSYTQEKAQEICMMIESGLTLTSICQLPGMPHISTVYDWQDANPGFADSYARARMRQADTLASRVIDEAMGSHDAQIGRLRMDALKWFASKMAPKKYGDKVEVETNSQQNFKISFSVPDRENTQELPEPVRNALPAVIDIEPEKVD